MKWNRSIDCAGNVILASLESIFLLFLPSFFLLLTWRMSRLWDLEGFYLYTLQDAATVHLIRQPQVASSLAL
jgi:hypothetical protein